VQSEAKRSGERQWEVEETSYEKKLWSKNSMKTPFC